jgi:hypothetical protein
MAQLRLTINGVTGSRAIDDAKAQALANILYDNAVLPNWPEGTPLPTTAQGRLQAVVDYLAVEIRDMARGYRRRSLREAAEAAESAELGAIDV